MRKIRVFLADDHAVVREGLKALIAAQPDMEVVGEAADGQQALRAAEASPDVVVMDISMPELNGAQATAELTRTAGLRVLALSVHEESTYLRSLLKAGATGYILKRSAAETLVAAIRTVAAGGMCIDPLLASQVINSFVGSDGTEQLAVELSEREAEVLRLIASGYSNKEIAFQMNVSVKTVESYKARAMQKLGIESRVEIVRYAMNQGWL